MKAQNTFCNRRELMKWAARLAAGFVVASEWKPLELSAAMPFADNELQTGNIKLHSGEFNLDAYFARPKPEGKYPAVLIVHDEQGLNDQIRSVCRRLAAAGFCALAPDLLSRTGSAARAADAIRELSVDATLQDLKSAFIFLDQNATSNSGQTSTIGFGWGGWRSLLLATNMEDVHKTILFYGATPSDGLSDLESPVLAHYAEFDFRNTGNALWTEQRLKELGKHFTYFVYPKVNYGFFDEGSPDYNAEQASAAWGRTLEFLKAPV
jgi:carboxymethylenebutenolidase